MKCNNCGKELNQGAKFCSGCGAELKSDKPKHTASHAPDFSEPMRNFAQPLRTAIPRRNNTLLMAVILVLVVLILILLIVNGAMMFFSIGKDTAQYDNAEPTVIQRDTPSEAAPVQKEQADNSQETETDFPREEQTDIAPNTQADSNEYGNLMAAESDSEIENYVKSFVRPLFNSINANIDSYSKQTSGSATLWYDDSGCVKKELPAGADNYNMSRQYYYESGSGEMVFAFVFKGTREHRLYFSGNRLIRYIDASGNIVNNPTSAEALELAEHALSEAY